MSETPSPQRSAVDRRVDLQLTLAHVAALFSCSSHGPRNRIDFAIVTLEQLLGLQCRNNGGSGEVENVICSGL